MFKPVEFVAYTNLVVIGYNPENADYDHPHGEIIGYASYVAAHDEDGYGYEIHVKTDRWEENAMKPAEYLAKCLNARWARLGKLPCDFNWWSPAAPIYGSKAYEEECYNESW